MGARLSGPRPAAADPRLLVLVFAGGTAAPRRVRGSGSRCPTSPGVPVATPVGMVAGTGFLGDYTTFSAASLESVRLAAAGERDAAGRRRARRLGMPVEYLELSGESHECSRADSRKRLLAATVRFLDAQLPSR